MQENKQVLTKNNSIKKIMKISMEKQKNIEKNQEEKIEFNTNLGETKSEKLEESEKIFKEIDKNDVKIDKNDDDEFSKELGDVLLHVLLHSVIAEQRGAFNIIDVINKIHKKMVHRHPHVFGDTKINSEDDVVKNWELLKKSEGKKSALEGVPKGLPALLKAERIQHKAAKVGFDWDDKNLVWDKVFEEVDELKETINKGDKVRMTEEFGDVLFSLVNAARHEQIVAEEALHFTNNKFIKRFQYIEKKAAEINLSLDDLSLSEMDKLWDEAKKPF